MSTPATVDRRAPQRGIALAVYGGLIVLDLHRLQRGAERLRPDQDKQYLVAIAQLPPAASLDRTEAVIRRMSARSALKTPGVAARRAVHRHVHQRLQCRARTPRIIFFALDAFDEAQSART